MCICNWPLPLHYTGIHSGSATEHKPSTSSGRHHCWTLEHHGGLQQPFRPLQVSPCAHRALRSWWCGPSNMRARQQSHLKPTLSALHHQTQDPGPSVPPPTVKVFPDPARLQGSLRSRDTWHTKGVQTSRNCPSPTITLPPPPRNGDM